MRMTHTQETVTAIQPRLVLPRVDDAVVFYEACFGAKLIEHFVDPNGVVVHAAILIGASIVTMAEEVSSWELLAPPSIGGSPVLLPRAAGGLCVRVQLPAAPPHTGR
jgi:PhnB protein